MTEQARCPIDQTPTPGSARHPLALCRACVAKARDRSGRPVTMGNTALTGGFAAWHRDDDTQCPQVTHDGLVLVDGVPCAASEARFGGIVVEVLVDTRALEPARFASTRCLPASAADAGTGTADFESRARGLMLGLLLGDAYAEVARPAAGPLHGTCLSQLACFTLEGMIRACVRSDTKGICHPPSVVWHAWCRWAHLQGLGPSFQSHWRGAGEIWPDGWLWQVQPLSVRRGTASSTVAALRRGAAVPDTPAGHSAGHHALTRQLPLAIFVPALTNPAETVGEVAGFTHGDREALELSTATTIAVAERLSGEATTVRLNQLAPRPGAPGTVAHALHHGGLAVSDATDFATAMSRAAPHGHGATSTAGALFGATHGVQALPPDLVNLLEIGWVGDRLARDAVAELRTHPAASGHSAPSDPTWWGRYPGW